MKNLSKLLLTLSIALPFAACGGDDSEDTAADTVTVTVTADDSGSSAGDDVADDVADDAPETGADDAPDTGADDAPDTGADDGAGMSCMHTCAANEDCQAMGGTDIGFICEGSTCVNGNPCMDDAFCTAQFSGWSAIPCTMGGGECMAAMQICVDLGDGTGGCATSPDVLACEMIPGFSEVMATNLDDGSEVTVCGNATATCDTDTGFCSSPCVDDTTCGSFVCNVDTGVCECDGDDDCAAVGEGSTCDAGTCTVPGCMSDADCMNPFNGGTVSCG